jgi:hypothetical protein
MKTKRRFFWLLLVFVICGTFVTISQAADKPKPDMSGKWERDSKKSRMGQMTEGELKNIKVTLEISHQEPELRISIRTDRSEKSVNREMIFYTDGRGETNIPEFTQVLSIGRPLQDPKSIPQNEVQSKTKWEGSKIVSTNSSVFHGPGGRIFHLDTREIRELSEDGKTLTIKRSISTPGGNIQLKEVYNRIP